MNTFELPDSAEAFIRPDGDLFVVIRKVTYDYVTVPSQQVPNLLDRVRYAREEVFDDPPDVCVQITSQASVWLFSSPLEAFQTDIENYLNGCGDPAPEDIQFLMREE